MTCVLSATMARAEAPCSPRVELVGERELVERVASALRGLGVDVDHGGGGRCAPLRAHVRTDRRGGIAVNVGGETRIVSDAVLAAAWIDSWTRDDLDLLAPPSVSVIVEIDVPLSPPGLDVSLPPAPVASPFVPPRDAPPAPATRTPSRVVLGALYEQSWTDDAAWYGASASACVRVGGFCIGARARAAFDPVRLYRATPVERADYSLLATAAYPLALGDLSIVPELGLGAGRVTTARGECPSSAMEPASCDPSDPACMVPPPITCDANPDPELTTSDHFRATTYTPRVAVAVRMAVPLLGGVWLDGIAGWSYTPLAHGSPFMPSVADPSRGQPDLVELPGEPASTYVLGIGLRLETQ